MADPRVMAEKYKINPKKSRYSKMCRIDPEENEAYQNNVRVNFKECLLANWDNFR